MSSSLGRDVNSRLTSSGIVDFNVWYQPEEVAEYDIGDADTALGNFFRFCYEAGPNQCAFWYNSAEEIRDRFFEADRRLLEKPIPIPGFGLLKTPRWRTGVYTSLYRPETFPLLAGVAAEIYNGTAGPAIQSYLEFLDEQRSAAEPALVDPTTGLKNSVNAYYWIACSDSGARGEGLGPRELEALYDRYAAVSQLFAGISSQFEIFCLGTSSAFRGTSAYY